MGRVVVDMDGLLPDGQFLLHNRDILLVVVLAIQFSKLLEGILVIRILVFLGEIVGAVLVSIARLLVKFVFLIEIRIQFGYFCLFLAQVKQVVEQQVANQGRQVLVVLEDSGKLIDDPFVDHAAESTHLGSHGKGRLLYRLAYQSAVVGTVVVLTVCADRQLLRLSIEDGDVLDFALVNRNGGDGVITDIQLVVLIEHELSPSVGCSCQHVVETLVILYQIGEDVLRLLIAIPQYLHVVSINGDVGMIILFLRFTLSDICGV